MANSKKTDTSPKEAGPIKAAPKKTGKQFPYAGKIYDLMDDNSTQRASTGGAVVPETLTADETGKIDLHLKSPEDVETTIKKEVEKLNDGFHVVIFDPEQNKLTPRKKIALLKELVMGKENPEDPTGPRVGGMSIKDKEDVTGYKKMDDTRKMLMKLRTGVADKHEALKANYLKVSRALDKEKNELTGLVSEIENFCKADIKKIDDAKAEEAAELERQRIAKRDERVAEIKAAGIVHENGFYSIGENISLDIVTLENLNDEQYGKLLERVKDVKKQIDYKNYKKEQRARVDRYLFERKERNQRAEDMRLQKVADDQKRERKDFRIDILTMLGFSAHKSGQYYQFIEPAGSVIVTVSELESLDGDAWRQRFTGIKSELEELTKKQNEKEEADKVKQRNNERVARLVSMGCRFDEKKGEFYFVTDKAGFVHLRTAEHVFNETANFEFLAETIKESVDILKEEDRKDKAEKLAKEQRTKNRVSELVNGFGMGYTDGQNYKRVSPYRSEPELSALVDLISIPYKEIEETEEAEWTNKISGLQTSFTKVQQAEKEVKRRKDAEAEDARVALLSEKQRVEEYLQKISLTEIPQNLTDPGLIEITKNILRSFKDAREKLVTYAEEKK